MADQILLDHDPICFLFEIDLPVCMPSTTHKSSYFKANSKILESPSHVQSLQSPWRSNLKTELDVRYKYHLTSRRLQSTYLGIQAEFEKLDQAIEQIKSKSLETNESPTLIAKYTMISCLLWDIESKEAIQWRKKSSIK